MDAHWYEFEVWDAKGEIATGRSLDRRAAMREALHYAAVYGQDGPVTVYEVKRTELVLTDAAEWLAQAG